MEVAACRVGNTHKVTLRAGVVHLSHDGSPDQPVRRVARRGWFPFDAHDRSDGRLHGLAIAAEQNNSWGAVAGNIDPSSVDDMGEVPMWDEALNEFLAHFAFHKRVGGYHSHVAGGLGVLGFHCQGEELLHEGRGHGVSPVAGFKAQAVGLVKCLVLNGNVGRIAHHGVIVLA